MFLNKTNKFVYRDFGFSLKSRCIKNKKKTTVVQKCYLVLYKIKTKERGKAGIFGSKYIEKNPCW